MRMARGKKPTTMPRMTRRADRLFQIAQILRGRRLTTAAMLAERLSVSERTVYRDIRDLSVSGVPIEGEAGIGYRMRAGFDIAPLMFTADEVEALVAGARMIKAWGGGTMADSVEAALEKLMGALPAERRTEAETTRIFAPGYGMGSEVKQVFDTLHAALGRHAVARLSYRDVQGQLTERCIQPLGLFFWGQVWLVAAWCEHRQDYRTFRLDRCVKVDILERHFAESAERSLADFMRKVRGSSD